MKTIKTETHILLIDETVDLLKYDKGLLMDNISIIIIQEGWNNSLKLANKIIAASPKLGDLPEFETLPPNTENDVEKLALELADKYLNNEGKNIENPIRSAFKFIYTLGYKQAKSETMFSLEQLRFIYDTAIHSTIGKLNHDEEFDRVIKFLTQSKEYEFVIEMEDVGEEDWIGDDVNGEPFWNEKLQPKIVNNKIQGLWKIV